MRGEEDVVLDTSARRVHNVRQLTDLEYRQRRYRRTVTGLVVGIFGGLLMPLLALWTWALTGISEPMGVALTVTGFAVAVVSAITLAVFTDGGPPKY